jgi:hypothetical protein
VARAVDVLALECRGGHPQQSGGQRQVGLGQVHEALLAATLRASGLALETQNLDPDSIMICKSPLFCGIFFSPY